MNKDFFFDCLLEVGAYLCLLFAMINIFILFGIYDLNDQQIVLLIFTAGLIRIGITN